MSPYRNTRGQRSRFRPAFEALEDRTVPAGNVSAILTGGTLVITGDEANNAVKIQGNQRGTVDVIALDTDTVINSQPGMVTLLGWNGGLVVNMAGGHDAVVVDSANVRGKFTADMGAGDDMLCLVLTTFNQDVDIRMGLGDDRVMFGCGEVKGNAYVNAETGNNQVSLLGANFRRDSWFVSGAGTSSIAIDGTKFRGAPHIINFQQRANAPLPRAVDETATVATGGSVTVNVASNDVAGSGDLNKGSIAIARQPAHGTVTVLGDGSITYKNDGSGFATDSFRYTIANTKGAVSNEGIVAFSITGTPGPSVSVTSSAGSATKTAPIPFTATFAADVTGFDQSDITVTNGTIGNFVATNGRVYTFTVQPTAGFQGSVVVTVPANVAQNAAGQGNTASTSTTVTFDTTPPLVTVNNLRTNSTTPTVSGTVNEANSKVKVTVNNLTFDAIVTGNAWTAAITPALAAGTYSVSATATDAAGNSSTTNGGSALIIDLTPPTVTITSSATSPTGLSSIPITVTFSEEVAGFVASDIVVGNGTLANFTANADQKTFTATINPTANGAVTANIAAGVCTDLANNPNVAAPPFSITFDNNILTVAVNPLTTNSATPTITGTVSQGTATVAVTVDGQTFNATVNGTSWSAVVPAALAAGTYTVSATATNPANATATNTATLVVDLTQPTVTITSTTTSPTGSTSIPITVTFSEGVSGFVAGDIVVGNATLSNFAQVSGSTTTFTATLTPTANGNVTANVAAGVASDVAGNTNTAAPTFTIAFDNTVPFLAHALSNLSKTAAAANSTILLPGTFGDANIGNSSVTFKALKGATPLDLNVELFDKDAPLTVANFFNYLDRYDDNGGTLFHRLFISPTLKVLQGGGFALDESTNTITGHLLQDAPIRNEFNPANLDLRGTLAMAKLGGDPDSATSEFFFNLDDSNANELNGNNNGGFVVFGELVGAADLNNLDNLATVSVKNTGAFQTLPLVDGNTIDANNVERVQSIVVNHRDDELHYTATSSNPAAATVALSGFQNNTLTLDYLAAGTTTITVTAIDKVGHTASTTFVVTVT